MLECPGADAASAVIFGGGASSIWVKCASAVEAVDGDAAQDGNEARCQQQWLTMLRMLAREAAPCQGSWHHTQWRAAQLAFLPLDMLLQAGAGHFPTGVASRDHEGRGQMLGICNPLPSVIAFLVRTPLTCACSTKKHRGPLAHKSTRACSTEKHRGPPAHTAASLEETIAVHFLCVLTPPLPEQELSAQAATVVSKSTEVELLRAKAEQLGTSLAARDQELATLEEEMASGRAETEQMRAQVSAGHAVGACGRMHVCACMCVCVCVRVFW